MSDRVPTIVSWSGGKDCAMAVHELQRSSGHEVVGLLTTVGTDSGRVAFHNVPVGLIRSQAASLGLPLHEVALPEDATNAEYEAALQRTIEGLTVADRLTVAYGDLFLADIRAYREELAARLGFTPLFPLWGSDTRRIARGFVAAGFEAIVVSVALSRLDGSLAGRRFDGSFLDDLPQDADACGENGEFHTFVTDGPNFSRPVRVSIGPFSETRRHCYRQLEPH